MISFRNYLNKINISSLNDIVFCYNNAKNQSEPTYQLTEYFQSLNLLWNSYCLSLREPLDNKNDTLLLKKLLVENLNNEEKINLCENKHVRKLAKLIPKIMDHKTIIDNNIDPNNITQKIAELSSLKHKEFEKEFDRFIKNKNLKTTKLIKKLSILLYTIRSNNAHGGKTPRGPFSDHTKRNNQICRLVIPILELIFKFLFNYPEKFLCTYGTLSPGEINHNILSNLKGDWHSCIVEGDITQKKGLPYFNFNENKKIKAMVLNSMKLTNKFSEIDSFEGNQYKRILIPAIVNDNVQIVNIYSENHY